MEVLNEVLENKLFMYAWSYIDFLESLDNEDLLMHDIINTIAKHPN
jgi:hypothetical protein